MDVVWTRTDLETARPFGIARWTHSAYPRAWVRLDDGEHEGWGEATPNAYYGETIETVLAVLPELSRDLPDDPWAWHAAAATMEARLPGHHRSAQAALEAAWMDLAGRRAGLPMHRLLGLEGRGGVTSVTVGLGTLEQVRTQAAEHARNGFPALKVKMGGERDEAILAAIRDAAPDARLRVDANGAWSAREAIRALAMLEAYAVELIEQPVAADDLDGLAAVTRASRVPIAADESFVSLRDLRRLHVDVVNVKIAKIGGPRRAASALEAARAMGFGTMLGCMIESSLAAAPAVHIAELADWLDVDGPLLLREDPWTGIDWGEHGTVRPGPGPGWGVARRTDDAPAGVG